MNPIIDNPYAVFAIALVAQWGAAFVGDVLRRRIRPLKKDEREDFDTVLAASLTLLALIIGFSYSMAVSRYDQRKNYEEAEANAIGTAYLRAFNRRRCKGPSAFAGLCRPTHRFLSRQQNGEP